MVLNVVWEPGGAGLETLSHDEQVKTIFQSNIKMLFIFFVHSLKECPLQYLVFHDPRQCNRLNAEARKSSQLSAI